MTIRHEGRSIEDVFFTSRLKRMEAQGILSRKRSGKDERKVLVSLTDKGKEIRHEAATIPLKLAEGLEAVAMTSEELTEIRKICMRFNNLWAFFRCAHHQ